MKPKTLAEALAQYRETVGKAKGDQAQTGLLRFCVPVWGGPVPQGVRARGDEVKAALEYLDTVPLNKLWDIVSTQEKGFEQMNASDNSRRNYRAAVKGLMDYGEQHGWRRTRSPISQPPEFKPKTMGIKYWEQINAERHKVYGQKKQGEVIRLTDEEIDAAPGLKEELQAFAQHLRQFVDSERTIDYKIALAKKFLGWKYRYDHVPLEELRLSSLIPYVKMKHDMLDFLEKGKESSPDKAFLKEVVATRQAQRECKEKAEAVIDTFNRYRNGYGKGTLSKTFVTELDCLISIAKFLYQKDTDYSSSKNGFVDIPVIVKLKDLQTDCRKASKKEKSRVPFAERSVPWENLGELLDGLKSYADWTQYITENRTPKKRTQRSIGIDLQRLLMVLFFVAIPPRRARTIRSLEVREVNTSEKVNTLERGIIEPGRGFVPARKLPEGSEIKWFLRLRDYKTHKTYGDQDIEVTNHGFADGTSFYSYLDLWLNEYRPLFKPEGDNLFVQVTSRSQLGQTLNASDFQSIIQRVTAKVLGVAITPKDFRHICSTYIMGRKDLSEKERRAIAWAMGHSLNMQEGTYNQTSSDTYRETIKSCYQIPITCDVQKESA